MPDRPRNPQPVKEVLAERGISLNSIAKSYGLETSTLSKIVNGRLTVSEPYAKALLEITGLPIAVLFETDLYMRTWWYGRQLSEEREAAGGERDE